ncbi:MAG: FGGY-family carbohydrate kinase [Polyangiaceae bacterium]|nr:FGGY-family carbohydrate kinase [Polyangiaceae bacterium]
MTRRLYLGVDVGTGSARAAIFDGQGARHGLGTAPVQIFRPAELFAEQSSEDIWRAVCAAVAIALREGDVRPEEIVGIGFDATCSLVALGDGDAPVTVSPTGDDAQNVILWMDHRAEAQAARINGGGHEVLRYVGGAISPEMETPKLAWLKENLPRTWERTRRFLDLPDFLVARATAGDVRSACTTTCKWTYLGHERRWDDAYFRSEGLGDLVDEGYTRIGTQVRPLGERAGELTAASAKELGLAAGTPVSVAIIDAHAGGLGMLGASLAGDPPLDWDTRLALIGGTSTCHMAVSAEPRFVPGVWGPYYAAMVPGLWLNEGGQSATGALVDHVIQSHARAGELVVEAKNRGTTVYALLNERLDALGAGCAFPAAVAADLHVLPDHHGNRSPRADSSLRGMISGLRLSDSVDHLARVYLATIQAIAHGTKHILDAMNACGYRIDTLFACGGDLKNPVFVREHADATGARLVLPAEPESVLLGAAMLGAVASGDALSVPAAMATMARVDRVVLPAAGDVAAFHARKHAVFLRMHEDQLAYRSLMHG